MDEELQHLRQAAAIAGLDPAVASLPRSRHLVVGGFRLHVLDWGGAGQPLLFLHGGALTAHSWDLVCVARPLPLCRAGPARPRGQRVVP